MPFRVLCAPDSFKETLSATNAAEALAAGVRDAGGEADVCPIADGGEGTLAALIRAAGGSVERTQVLGPLGTTVDAKYGVLASGVGVVELAEASGLALVPPQRRDPTRTTTYGSGQLIQRLIGSGVREVIVCVGGSATTDGGTGLAQALGASFFDRGGRRIVLPLDGGSLLHVSCVGAVSLLSRIRVACDVTNPLFGPTGAAAVYGPQKGATPGQVALLDAGLRHLAALCGADPYAPGTGAAGGAAYGLAALCGATIERGVDLVLDTTGFAERCRGADLVLTGEGRLDAQTASGKAVAGVAAAAGAAGVPTIAIAGTVVSDADVGLRLAISVSERFGVDRSMREPATLLRELAREVVEREQLSGSPSPLVGEGGGEGASSRPSA